MRESRMQDKELAMCVVKAISEFLLEMEGAKTRPNVVHMHKEQLKAVKTKFPYLIEAGAYKDGNDRLKIILNDSDDYTVGVSFSFYTEHVQEYKGA
jgi:hypothetical protein